MRDLVNIDRGVIDDSYPVPKKLKKLDGNINNTDVVIVYGDVKGNVNNCDNVIVINGDVYGNITNCDNVAGLISDQYLCHDRK